MIAEPLTQTSVTFSFLDLDYPLGMDFDGLYVAHEPNRFLHLLMACGGTTVISSSLIVQM
jgi:hypothetical protein